MEEEINKQSEKPYKILNLYAGLGGNRKKWGGGKYSSYSS